MRSTSIRRSARSSMTRRQQASGSGNIKRAGGIDCDRASFSRGDDHFQAHSETARHVNSRLDAEDHSFFDQLRVASLEVRRLMHLQAKAVAGAMQKIGSIAGVLDD